jgi:Arc/MetJ-type ribon-helix-helix transcriptional regulator
MKKDGPTYHTLSLPHKLYRQLEQMVKSTGFRSPTEYIIYLLRRSLAEIEKEKERLSLALGKKKSSDERRKILLRFKRLGYFS